MVTARQSLLASSTWFVQTYRKKKKLSKQFQQHDACRQHLLGDFGESLPHSVLQLPAAAA
jgi:hypothetical protein